MSAYIFSVYNADVRDAVQDNREHPLISERWAAPCLFEIEAQDVKAAEASIKRKYPAEDGFITKRLN
ncbi:hypothetical protein [Sneathiella sp.]|uniref:hypothetical protein n=1 Tax=Sneathiella sp. TaxID=1964365 RepID=UPI003569374E